MIADLLTKTFGIVQMGLATVLLLHAQKAFGQDQSQSKYWFFASAILFGLGSLFMVVSSSSKEGRRTRR